LKGARQENHVPSKKSVLTKLLYSVASTLLTAFIAGLLALACHEGQGGGAHLAVRYDIVAFSAGSVSALAHVARLSSHKYFLHETGHGTYFTRDS